MPETDEIRSLPMPVRPAKLAPNGRTRLVTAERESYNLEKFGTGVCALTAGALLQAAERDLQTRDRNRRIANARTLPKGESIWAEEEYRPYGFLARHVKPAADAAAVLEAAILGRAEGLRSGRTDRLRLYRDGDTLFAALRLAEAQR